MMRRRDVLKMSAGAAAIVAAPSIAKSNTSWPDKPVKVIVPYAPGGATDIVARPWAEALGRQLGQQFVIENRGGAGGMIGTEAVSKATPDGYTLLLPPCAVLTVLPLLQKVPYDPQTSFQPVARIGDTVSGFVIHPAAGPRTLKETIEYAKANPGKLSYGSAGNGSITHLRIEMLKYRTGVDILHVPYRGSGEALSDLLANNIQMMCEMNPLPHVKAGKLTLLCINHPKRSPDFPDIPTLTECGYPNSDLISWYSLWAPAGTPKEIVQKLNKAIVDLTATADMQATMRRISAVSLLQSPDEMSATLAQELKGNADLIKAVKIKLE